MSKIEIFTDGGARGNPGPAAVGFVVKKDGRVIHRHGETIGRATNNVAEYTAVLKAMQWLKINNSIIQSVNNSIIFYLDSKLVVEQLSGRYKIKNPNLKALWCQIKILESNLKVKIIYQNIQRSLNTMADSLVNEALDSHITLL